MTDMETVKARYPDARLIGPSGDGCHVEVNGKWFAYGNIPQNAWASARALLEAKAESPEGSTT